LKRCTMTILWPSMTALMDGHAHPNRTAETLRTHPAISREIKSCCALGKASGSETVRPKCGSVPSAYVIRLALPLSKYSSLKPRNWTGLCCFSWHVPFCSNSLDISSIWPSFSASFWIWSASARSSVHWFLFISWLIAAHRSFTIPTASVTTPIGAGGCLSKPVILRWRAI